MHLNNSWMLVMYRLGFIIPDLKGNKITFLKLLRVAGIRIILFLVLILFNYTSTVQQLGFGYFKKVPNHPVCIFHFSVLHTHTHILCPQTTIYTLRAGIFLLFGDILWDIIVPFSGISSHFYIWTI